VWQFAYRFLPFVSGQTERTNMNSIYDTEDFDGASSATELERKLKQMEKAGASWEDCAATAIDFLDSQQENPDSELRRSEPKAADEELSFDDDPGACGQDAGRSEPPASKPEQTSDPNAGQSAQRSESSPEPEPEPERELPPPPKFQFGVGNPLYEAALDFRAYRDKRSILDHLTDTERDAIFKLLEHYSEEKVADLLAKAPPAGLSIQVSRATLYRFKKRYEKQARRRNSINFQLELDRLLNSTGVNDQAFLAASERYLKMRLFEITGDPNSSLETIAKLTHVITTLRKQALAEHKASRSNPDSTAPPLESNASKINPPTPDPMEP
jgi:hypothetical protein